MRLCRICYFVVAVLSALLVGCAKPPRSTEVANPHLVAAQNSEPYRLIISLHDQRMALLRGQAVVTTYVISTAKNGASETFDSGGTPRGRHSIAEKIGAALPVGSVFDSRIPTGEVLAINAPGRWPPVTRILRLRGLEEKNLYTLERMIYIHGSPAENQLGMPVSGGCIRMRSEDVVTLFSLLKLNTEVDIFEEPLSTAMNLQSEADRRLTKLEEAADADDKEALHELCLGHAYGINGIARNANSTSHRCLQSSLHDDAMAYVILADSCERGYGVIENRVEARRLYQRAADLGHPVGQYKAGVMLRDGIGGIKDAILAEKYLDLFAAYQAARPPLLQLIEDSKNAAPTLQAILNGRKN